MTVLGQIGGIAGYITGFYVGTRTVHYFSKSSWKIIGAMIISPLILFFIIAISNYVPYSLYNQKIGEVVPVWVIFLLLLIPFLSLLFGLIAASARILRSYIDIDAQILCNISFGLFAFIGAFLRQRHSQYHLLIYDFVGIGVLVGLITLVDIIRKRRKNKTASQVQEGKFKSIEEYEKWKQEKLEEWEKLKREKLTEQSK